MTTPKDEAIPPRRKRRMKKWLIPVATAVLTAALDAAARLNLVDASLADALLPVVRVLGTM